MMGNRSKYSQRRQPRPPAKAPKPKWIPQYCDDIRGPRRAAIIAEHLQWLEVVASEKVEMDFSDAPIAKAFGRYRG